MFTEPTRTALYRLFDAGDTLLYVGVTDDPRTRFRQHRRDKPWWPQVAMKDVEWFADSETALAEERKAILEEMPRHNQRGVPWFNTDFGDAPVDVVTMGDFKFSIVPVINGVFETGEPIILTRRGKPLVAIVPIQREIEIIPRLDHPADPA